MAKRKSTGMKPRDVRYVLDTIENEGFDYTFSGYSDFDEIEGEEFHRLRKECRPEGVGGLHRRGGRMIRELQRNTLAGGPVHCQPGDELVCIVEDNRNGVEHEFGEKIGRNIDTVVTFDVRDEFCLEDGIGAVFGKSL